MGHVGLIFSLIHPYTHTSTPKETESGPWAPDPPQPNPRKQPPHNYLPEHTGQAPTHLGKLGNAPGPVRCGPTVGGPSGPGPSPLHGPQRAQFQAPRRRLGRAGERLVFRQLAEGPLSGAGAFIQICLLQHSLIHSFNQPTKPLGICWVLINPGHVTETKDQFCLLLSNKRSWGARWETR